MPFISTAAFPAQRPRLASPLVKTVPVIQSLGLLRGLAHGEMDLLNAGPRPRLPNGAPQQQRARAMASTSNRDVHSPNQGLMPLFRAGVTPDAHASNQCA